MSATINYLTKIRFGDDALEDLADELTQLGVATPLIVTDAGLTASGLVTRVQEAIGGTRPAAVYDGTPANPTEDAIEDAVACYREHACDGIVALGGGSSIDLAKGVALLASHPAPLRQYAVMEGGAARIGGQVLPLVAIPTTAGTGSEVGRAALISMRDERKLGFLSPHLIPDVAICDPLLTLSLPAHLTAATGMDAIAHCVETFLSPRFNPPADAIALDGLQRATRHIRTAVSDGSNLDARREMLMAATQGALAFQKGLGAVHSLSHALGGFHDLKLHHGTLNALLMPIVLRFNQDHCGDKFARLRDAMGLAPGTDVVEAFTQLNIDLGLPMRLSDLGVTRERLAPVAQWALEDHSTATNPRAPTHDDFQRMLLEAL
ncbi:iron-containing alcohol dehydrogenase [Chromohalobacter canadensis]|uniref:Iron-containing alcohol dehydrogenase n=1 Tax=Chromohalobacter canadensis TaxID=141389 RepID=A0ABZ0YAR5_9GAMM|nr:iron-containing alcohol dehydrogenase [Chromohalobacter canadensis]MCK0769450.1 iron-containing alcohol dehydrogenase [Chromohalobacter canadensis]MCT8468122.1 iron-containing alcohol dehydrogenase [Chromohalobacter canadensis]MCT8470168.1 iron-containing alcohol dehydrogenase [Chromohalobacter canadensis]MCT8498630.1 iron-containing alcohol dehydrogenase [Chromohalobacter canadensis]WQH09021.1 iron-containing alcohol dehydrogenase [Chromohalobacter canadensis]